jgi:general secretion pathway protein G
MKGRTQRIAAWSSQTFALAPRRASNGGWTLIELVITMTVLAVLSMGVIPMVKTAVKRQREQQLRDSLREMREAIKEFHRDAVGSPYLAQAPVATTGQPPLVVPDPRSKMMIADKTIFSVDNQTYHPPSLETLVQGVNVAPRVQQINTDINKNLLDTQATLAFKKRIYLRKIPVDPMTGTAEWGLRSSYDSADSGSWGGENVFDVYSKSQDTALNGQKYSDW